jgi:L-ascorbate metabolism protein UlaG (beta-lactamase superfamily)
MQHMKIIYFGHSAFRIETGNSVVMLDPFLTGNPLFKGDSAEVSRGATHVLLTHGHDDHTGDTAAICKANDATLIANFEVANWFVAQGVEKYSPGNQGGRQSHEDFDVVFTNAWHSSSTERGGKPVYLGNPLGFVLIPKKERGKTLYITGDTGITMDMKLVQDLYKPAFGIMCIGDRFTMGPDQAAYACRKFFKFKTVIPCHYRTFEGFLIPDAKPFVKAMGPDRRKVKVMEPGQSLTL